MTKECNCPCCKPQEDELLKYSILELNRRLNDVPINASMRYRDSSEDNPLILDISSAVALVPEKDKAVGKLLTFLNSGNEIEIWLYIGSNIDMFNNISYWRKLYKSYGIHGGFSDTLYNL